MLSQIPLDLSKVKKEDIDKEIMRIGMMAELDAVNLYEQLAATAQSEDLKKALIDIAKEEKTHIGEFEALLLANDPEQVSENTKAQEEIKKILSK